MSDNFEMLVDVEVSLGDSRDLADAVIADFRSRGFIAGDLTPDSVLAGSGYEPGPTVSDIYKSQSQDAKFWTLSTSGLEPQVERSFNSWALGPSCEGFTCPKCSCGVAPFVDEFNDAMMVAIEQWLSDSGAAELACPKCKESTAVTSWHAKPPLGFGNLSFRFWNWPPFDSPGWQFNIPKLVQEITGHTIVRTWGHI